MNKLKLEHILRRWFRLKQFWQPVFNDNLSVISNSTLKERLIQVSCQAVASLIEREYILELKPCSYYYIKLQTELNLLLLTITHLINEYCVLKAGMKLVPCLLHHISIRTRITEKHPTAERTKYTPSMFSNWILLPSPTTLQIEKQR